MYNLWLSSMLKNCTAILLLLFLAFLSVNKVLRIYLLVIHIRKKHSDLESKILQLFLHISLWNVVILGRNFSSRKISLHFVNYV